MTTNHTTTDTTPAKSWFINRVSTVVIQTTWRVDAETLDEAMRLVHEEGEGKYVEETPIDTIDSDPPTHYDYATQTRYEYDTRTGKAVPTP